MLNHSLRASLCGNEHVLFKRSQGARIYVLRTMHHCSVCTLEMRAGSKIAPPIIHVNLRARPARAISAVITVH